MLVIEKYAKNGSKHENGPNWAGSRVQAVRLTRGFLPRRYARMRRDASHLAASRVTPGLGGQRQAIRLGSDFTTTTPYHTHLKPWKPWLELGKLVLEDLEGLKHKGAPRTPHTPFFLLIEAILATSGAISDLLKLHLGNLKL
ncbi:hypothetical protein E3N88_14897 [Mikania micrantha]|uniref:Uncharacterized protein n=1 Tax=Mikania micrantha TaxID=192012 RepID=A0A5N6P417_9ASTR|nr:hypothetical protein E3N88_14897 [Mikania micrantha]